MIFEYNNRSWELRDGTFYDGERAIEVNSRLHRELCVATMRPDGVVVWEGQLGGYRHRVVVQSDGVSVEYGPPGKKWWPSKVPENEVAALRLAVLALVGKKWWPSKVPENEVAALRLAVLALVEDQS